MHNYQFIEAFRFNPYDNLYFFFLINLPSMQFTTRSNLYFIKSEHSEVQFSLLLSRL